MAEFSWTVMQHKFRTLPTLVFIKKGIRFIWSKIEDHFLGMFYNTRIILIPKNSFSMHFDHNIEKVFSNKERSLLQNELSVLSSSIWSRLAESVLSQESIDIADQALDHRFSVLGIKPIVVEYGFVAPGFDGYHPNAPGVIGKVIKHRVRMATLVSDWAEYTGSEEDVTKSLIGYSPIEWHVDMRSGYRFPQEVWHRKLPRIMGMGVDIKVPWCLSRFQHAPLMAIRGHNDITYRNEFILQVVDWITANPCGWGVNWACPMEVAIRAVNWIWAVGYFAAERPFPFWFVCLLSSSLSEHGRFIVRNLEFSDGYGGNHYLANLLGLLLIAAALPEATESDSWLIYALQEMESEIEKTVNTDGFYAEGALFYQALVAEMYLHASLVASAIPEKRREALSLKQCREPLCFRRGAKVSVKEFSFDLKSKTIFSPTFFNRLHLLVDFLDKLRGPDGGLPQFGDNDGSEIIIHPSRTHNDVRKGSLYIRAGTMLDLAGNHKIVKSIVGKSSAKKKQKGCIEYFKHSGFAVLRWPPFFLVVKTGHKIGSFGGHVHSDVFSFDLWVRDSVLFVDPGTYVYGAIPELRNYFRSCSAHNTLCTGELQHLDMPTNAAGLFIARQQVIPVVEKLDNNSIIMRHTAFPCSDHVRRFCYEDGKIQIEDEFEAGESWLTFQLDPLAIPGIPQKHGSNVWESEIRCGGQIVTWSGRGFGLVEVLSSQYSPSYGLLEHTSRIRAQRLKSKTYVTIQLEGHFGKTNGKRE